MFHDDKIPSLQIKIADFTLDIALDFGFFYSSGATSPDIHTHAYYELLAVINGEIALEVLEGNGDSNIPMHSGAICLIPPNVYHCTKSISNAPDKLAVRFTLNGCDTESPQLFADCNRILSCVHQPLIFTEQHELCSTLLSIRRELNAKRWASDVFVNLHIQEFFMGAMRLICEQNGASIQSGKAINIENRHAAIEAYIDLHHTSPITEEDLAQELNLSKRQLTRVMREIYGTSFREKLIETRLYHALHLLMQTDSSVEKIAFAVGYTSLSGFYSAFKKRFGVPASEYRTQRRDQS